MISLPKARGFGQRHFDEIKMTPALIGIIPDTGKRRSPVTLPLIRKDLMEFQNLTERPKDEMLDYAIEMTRREFMLSEKVKMIHLNDIFYEDLDIWHSSPGLPWNQYGYRTKGEVRNDPENIRKIRQFWHYVKSGKKVFAPDSLAYVRSHIADSDSFKVRAVWGYPMTVTMGEAMYALPLIKAFGDKHLKPIDTRRIAYGYETYCGGTRRIFNRFAHRKHVSGLDFSKFDKTVPAWLIEIAFSILSLNIDFGHYRDYGVADARKNIRMWNYLKWYFINTPIRLSDGTRYRKSSGVASGSYFTQLIDSVVNAVLINWMTYSQYGREPLDWIVLGDDSLVATEEPVDAVKATLLFLKIGMFLNFEKSQFNQPIQEQKFLGYTVGIGFPTRPREELLASLAFPERPDRNLADLQSRALGILFASCGADRYVYELCKAIIQFKPFDIMLSGSMRRYMKYVLGIDFLSVDDLPTAETLLMRVW